MIGDIGVYNALCTEISATLGLPVVSVEYRLAPEHPFPAALDDVRWSSVEQEHATRALFEADAAASA